MRLKRTEQFTILAITALTIASIAIIYIRNYELDKKIDLCKAYVTGAYETTRLCKDNRCEQSVLILNTGGDIDLFSERLQKLKQDMITRKPYVKAIQLCDQMQ